MNSSLTFIKYFFFLCLLSPILAIYNLFRLNDKNNIVFGSTLLMGLYGALFAYPKTSDSETHLLKTINVYGKMSFSEFLEETFFIFIQQSNIDASDLYLHFLQFISASIGIPSAIHFFAGLVLGFLISKSILLIYYITGINYAPFYARIFIFMILLIHGFIPLNAIRTGTGMWLVLFSSLSYYRFREKKYLFLLVLSSQIHFGYLLMIIPVIIVFFTYKRKYILVAFYVFSFFFSYIQVDFREYLPNTKTAQLKASNIHDQESLESYNEMKEENLSSAKFHYIAGPLLFNFGIMLLLFLYIPSYLKSLFPEFDFLMGCGYLLFGLSNFFDLIPGLQGRLIALSTIYVLFSMFIFYMFNQNYDILSIKYLKIFNFVFIIISIPLIYRNLIQFTYSAEVFFISFPLATLISTELISINDFIKYFIL